MVVFLLVLIVSDMRTLAESERNTLPRGWVRQAVMGVLRWKDVPAAQPAPQQHHTRIEVGYKSNNIGIIQVGLQAKRSAASAGIINNSLMN
ncbi:unnamed protein product [Acanthoscelides obtectus]|uniref:Secreted protein n=1 Tax=Acanthoscelides obtectus TaxID=200917 RepID=A0A9P0P876_ACAOB|nr:unnamed protein product [Acanthoscelides obtectus]CAK1676541.1 hypothetical protein AOBTE_LOCUS30809 [Acanthoscelides obtectus]